jgi:polyphosphate glucokinase
MCATPGRAQPISARAVFQQRWRCAAPDAKIASGAAIMDNAASTTASQRGAGAERRAPRTLAVDIGGTGIKAELLDELGRPLTERARIPTPRNATPRKVIAAIGKLAKMQGAFDRVSVGFPGVIKDGVVYTAPNLGRGWNNFDLQRELRRVLKRPLRVANDADVQGLGAVSGRGVELVITLGTGFGSVIFVDGHRIHMELGHHPFRKGRSYEDELGHRALRKKGKRRWNRRLREAIEDLKQTFNCDRLFIGGGNTKYIRFEPSTEVKIVSNEEGLLGGIKLWQGEPARASESAAPRKSRLRPVAEQVAAPRPALGSANAAQAGPAAVERTTPKNVAAKAARAQPAARKRPVPKPAASKPAVSAKAASASEAAAPAYPTEAAHPDSGTGSADAEGSEAAAAHTRAEPAKMPV